MSPRTLASAAPLALLLASAGCDRAREAAPRGPAITRLFDVAEGVAEWKVAGRPLAPADVVAAEICGDVRPALIADAGALFECATTLPAVASWLDVDAGVLASQDSPAESAPPPPARLTVELRVGTRVIPLYDGFLSAGTPPTAFGFGRARIELDDRAHARGERATFTFRVATAAPAGARRVALGNPRLSPRVDANARSGARIDLFCRGPTGDELAAAGGAQRWPAFRRLQEAGAGFTPGSIAAAPPDPDATTETAGFGQLAELFPGSETRWDALARSDPYGFRADDPFVAAHRGGGAGAWDETLLRDRCRALGERALFRALAQPRAAELQVALATRAEGAELDAALARLLDHLRANELWERTELAVHVVRAAGDGTPAPGERLGAWVR